MRAFKVLLAATGEMVEAAHYYDNQSPGLGAALLEEIQRSLDEIAAQPEAYPPISRRARRKPPRRFPFHLIYAVYPDRIRVVALAHQKRRPFYWRSRITD